MINIIHKKYLFIKEQLKLEKELLHKSQENFCLINEGSKKTIVLGTSNNRFDWLNAKTKNIPIVKRFTSGGAVIVDKNTLFITFIFSKKFLNFSFPNEIWSWVQNFYKQIFNKDFYLKENDFVINNKKFAGNAQYIKKDRWLHHSSFLWDFKDKNMKLLKLPPKMPKYRKNREHKDFLCRLKNNIKISKKKFIQKIIKTLEKNTKLNLYKLKKI